MKKIHFMGAGGAGTSAAAALAKEFGFQVSGCDTDKESVYLHELKRLSVKIESSHTPSHLKDVDILVVSAAVEKFDSENPETLEAKKRGLTVFPTEKFVSQFLIKDKFLIAVAGTHGKSTTTAMIGQILEESSLDPTVYVGSIVTKWGRNYRFGKSKYFILEADEYEDKFLNYHPDVGIIINIEYDHPDYFKDEDQVIESFVKFVKGFKDYSKLIVGTLVESSRGLGRLTKEIKDITKIISDNDNFGIKLQIPGKHNMINAQAAFLCAESVGVNEGQIKKTLSKFSGISRRFEFNGEFNNIKIFDDYAHHPSEVSATLSAAREKFPNERIWCVFQPHTYSRTSALFEDFVKTFEEASVDKLLFVDIYAARERNPQNISSLDLAKGVKGKKSVYIGGLDEAAIYVAANAASGDIIFVIGAGDIYKLSQILLNKLKGQNERG